MPRLKRVNCSAPGIGRRRRGRGFEYLDADGAKVDDPEDLQRIAELRIPPAWRDVWICPDPYGHLQATGIDAAGRKQYLYHERWRLRRDREKFADMIDFARALPLMRRRVDRALRAEDMTRERVLACRGAAARPRLLPRGRRGLRGGERELRPGDDQARPREPERQRLDHLRLPGQVRQRRIQSLLDPDVYEVVDRLKRRRGGGDELLAYRDGRRWRDIRSADINAYVKEVTGGDFSAKDFRTWNATVLAAVALAVSGQASDSQTARKRAESRAVKEVARYLGNTPAVCRASYIDPRVFDRFRDGLTIGGVLPQLADVAASRCRDPSRRRCST